MYSENVFLIIGAGIESVFTVQNSYSCSKHTELLGQCPGHTEYSIWLLFVFLCVLGMGAVWVCAKDLHSVVFGDTQSWVQIPVVREPGYITSQSLRLLLPPVTVLTGWQEGADAQDPDRGQPQSANNRDCRAH